MADLIHQVEATAAAERAKKGVEPLGTEKILAQDPETRPETLDRSPAPFVHAASRMGSKCPVRQSISTIIDMEVLFPGTSLDGPQRVTAMSIHRTQEGGGSFVAPLAVNTRLTFIPVKSVKTRNPRKLELKASVSFPGNPLPWSFKNTAEVKSISSVTVDTNGDLSPDTRLPGTSNFSAGLPPDLITAPAGGGIGPCACPQPCHMQSGCDHCYWPSNCYPVPCD